MTPRRVPATTESPACTAYFGIVVTLFAGGQARVRGLPSPDDPGEPAGGGSSTTRRHLVGHACLHQLPARGHERPGRPSLRCPCRQTGRGKRVHGRRHDRHRRRVQARYRGGSLVVRRALRDDRPALADGSRHTRRTTPEPHGRLRAARGRDGARTQHPRRPRARRRRRDAGCGRPAGNALGTHAAERRRDGRRAALAVRRLAAHEPARAHTRGREPCGGRAADRHGGARR